MKNHKNSFKRILKPTFSVGMVLFLLIQVLAGTLAPVSFDGKDFWKSGFQKQEAEAAVGIAAYTYKKSITFNTTATGAAVSGNVGGGTITTGFPVAVHINSSSWPTQADRDHFFNDTYNPLGKRVQFFDSNETTVLNYEVEYYSTANQEAIYWVGVPQIDGNSSTDKIVVAYGNDPNLADQDNKNNVWDSNFKMVQHLGDNSWGTSPEAKDSTVNANNGTNTGATPNQTGQVRNGVSFDETNDYIGDGSYTTIGITSTNALTRSYWLNPATTAATRYVLGDGWGLITTAIIDGTLYVARPNITSNTTSISASTWTYIADTYTNIVDNQADTTILYKNGVQVDTHSGTNYNWGGGNLTYAIRFGIDDIGRTSTVWYSGLLDEIRYSNIIRSADWTKLEYYSMKKTNFNGDNGVSSPFITYGSQQCGSGNCTPDAPTSLAQYKSDCSTSISTGGWTNETSVCLKGYISDPDTNDQVKIATEVTTGSFTGTPNFTASSYVTDPNTSSVSATSLVNGSQYRWQGRSLDDDAATSGFTQFNSGNLSFGVDTAAPPAPTLTCTVYTHNTWVSSSSSTTCTITDTATPSPKTATAYSTNGGSSWTDNSNNLGFSFTPSEGTTNVIMRISDTGGGPTNSNTWTIKRDISAPTSTSISWTTPTNSVTPTLTLSATDANSGMNQMRFSCNNSTWSTAVSYATSYSSFNLNTGAGCSSGDGAKTVYVQFSDAVGNWSSSVNQAGILDTAAPPAPTLTCTVYTHNTWVSSSSSTTCTITDTATPSPKTATAYSTNGGSSWTDNSNNLGFSFTPSEGTTNVIMRISDTGGGPTNSNTWTIKRDITAPAGGSVSYTDGYYTSTSVPVTVNDGTDSLSGLNTSTRTYQRRETALSSGNCDTGSWGSWGDISGSYPSFNDTTVQTNKCYQYRYLISDNVSNQATYTSSNTAKVDATVPVISSISPSSSSDINSITSSSDVSYTLSETIQSGTIVFTRTGGALDGSSPHTCTLKGTALNTGAHSNIDLSDTTNSCTSAQSLVSGTIYKVDFNATDLAGNAAAQVENTNITFDNTAPGSTLTAVCDVAGNSCTLTGEGADPQEAYVIDSLTGTAADTGGSGLNIMEISIKDTDISVNKWYNPATNDFDQSSEYWITATDTASWNYDTSGIGWTLDHIYQLRSQAVDNAQNTESPPQSLDFKFVNSPPVVSGISSASQQNHDESNPGEVVISGYTLADEENCPGGTGTVSWVYLFSQAGATLNEELTADDTTAITLSNSAYFPTAGTILIGEEAITYTNKSGNDLVGTITRGANNTTADVHSSSTTVWLKADTFSSGGSNLGSNISCGDKGEIVWTAKTDIEYYSASQQIKIVANDGAAASMIGADTSSAFEFDTLDPVLGALPVLVDATPDPSDITLDCADDTDLEMKVGLTADLSGYSWESYNTSKSLALVDDPETVYARFQDAKGNITSIQSVTAPQTPTALMSQDISNMNTLPAPELRLFLAWQENEEGDFQEYSIRRCAADCETTGAYTEIDTETDQAANYYTNEVPDDTAYYYKVAVKDTDGNYSWLSGYTCGQANGTQDACEGGGGSAPGDFPEISEVTAGTPTSTSVTITWETDDPSDSVVQYMTNTGGDFEGNNALSKGKATFADSDGNLGDHTITLTGLAPDTTYYYQVISTSALGAAATDKDGVNGYSFTTDSGPAISSMAVSSETNDGATVSWDTDVAATSFVYYSDQSDLADAIKLGTDELTTDHSATLSGLNADTDYYFKIESTDANSATTTDDNGGSYYSFTTNDSTGPVISSLSVPIKSDGQAAIYWTTDESSTSQIRYKKGTDDWSSWYPSSSANFHFL